MPTADVALHAASGQGGHQGSPHDAECEARCQLGREHWSGVAAGEYFTLVLAFDTNTYQTGTVPIQLKRNDVTGFTESAEANWAWAVQVIK